MAREAAEWLDGERRATTGATIISRRNPNSRSHTIDIAPKIDVNAKNKKGDFGSEASNFWNWAIARS